VTGTDGGREHTVKLDADTHQHAERVASNVGISIHQLLPLIIKNALVFAESIFSQVVGGGGTSGSAVGGRRH
jgi:hypothetical protein